MPRLTKAIRIAELLQAIDDATAPSLMSKAEALDLLEELIDDVKMRCEALREEIKNEQDEADGG
jgi:hypothetical protein